MSSALITLGNKLAERFDMGENGHEVISVLKATAFKGPATDAQLTALMIVAQQYGLNPFTKELYAFPDRQNGIVPVVGVDGWARIINEHPMFDGLDFEQDEESCTCVIHRKDRGHPTRVTEYLAECKRGAGPWLTHPKRMLRHKALIQAARLAFGFVGIFDQDEAERIVEIDVTPEKESNKSEARSEWDKLDTEEQEWMLGEAMAVTAMTSKQDIEGAYLHIESLGLEEDRRIAFESRLDSQQRALIKNYSRIIHTNEMSALSDLWESVPKYAKPILEAVKDKRKAKLTEPERAAA